MFLHRKGEEAEWGERTDRKVTKSLKLVEKAKERRAQHRLVKKLAKPDLKVDEAGAVAGGLPFLLPIHSINKVNQGPPPPHLNVFCRGNGGRLQAQGPEDSQGREGRSLKKAC